MSNSYPSTKYTGKTKRDYFNDCNCYESRPRSRSVPRLKQPKRNDFKPCPRKSQDQCPCNNPNYGENPSFIIEHNNNWRRNGVEKPCFCEEPYGYFVRPRERKVFLPPERTLPIRQKENITLPKGPFEKDTVYRLSYLPPGKLVTMIDGVDCIPVKQTPCRPPSPCCACCGGSLCCNCRPVYPNMRQSNDRNQYNEYEYDLEPKRKAVDCGFYYDEPGPKRLICECDD